MTETPSGTDFSSLSCPIPRTEYPHVLLAHGGGGRLTQQLIEKMFLPQFDNRALGALHDGAVLELDSLRLAFSTDSYVIRPIFFPGGDIGSLAVHGTVNDLAMCGARPLVLSAGFIIEEGLPMEDLWRIVRSMQAAAAASGTSVVTGDTKVVDRGKGDRIFINTSGIGRIREGVEIHPRRARPGDRIIASGSIADHGIAILSRREGLEFETELQSDSAPLTDLVEAMLDACPDIHVLRDPTRGGLASALNEIAAQASVGMQLEESALVIREEVRGACELLGLDPLYVANEGKLLAIVAPGDAARVLETMRAHPLGRQASLIGEVSAEHPGTVLLRNPMGGRRVVDMLSGEQLPRIC
jgi:hydrogenase expression/formation protein HypE